MTTNDVMESGQLVVTNPSSKNSSLLRTTKDVSQNFSESKIRVLIVDDLRLVCEGLQAIFADDQSIEIVGFALNGQDAMNQIDETKPDVVVLDLLMPVMGGIEATKKITQKYPDLKILILTSFDDDSVVSEVIAAGANGYVLKNMVIGELALAIRSVHSGSYHFAAGLLNSLATIAAKHCDYNDFNFAPQDVCTIDSPVVPATPKASAKTTLQDSAKTTLQDSAKTILQDSAKTTPQAAPKTTPQANKAIPKKVKPKKPKPEKPLLPYADWLLVVSGIIVLSQLNGAGHNLAHAGLFLLMLALMARPVRVWCDIPLKYRRGIGVIAFAAALAHAIYATRDFLEGNLATISLMSTQNKWGLWAGIISLAIMAPAAVTSFQFMQRKLGKAWRKIHLLSLPSMFLAVFHTILVGPHYLMPDAQVEVIDYSRTGAIILVGILIGLLRQRIVWSKLKLNNLGKSAKKPLKA
jgi:DNA-binding NarL/FixJ family response regulator/DMSO/TMAO reductase YedYZ heme-binding membrane subunit